MPEKKQDDDKTFTQADVDRIVADRLKRESDKYKDYDELKAKAAQADADAASRQSDEEKRAAADKAQADKLAALEKRADEADARALRAEVASSKGLTAAQAKRLTGSTREELEADADELLESFKPSTENGNEGGNEQSKQPPGSPPRETLRTGAAPAEPEPDLRKAIAEIPR